MKRTVAIDLDGTLAHYDGWKGVEQIGDPLPGAKEFVERVMLHAEVLIYTTRGNAEMAGRHGWGPNLLRKIIAEWLEKHSIPYSDIWIGQGKPIYSAVLDDKAISCRPQEKGEIAYKEAIDELFKLLRLGPE